LKKDNVSPAMSRAFLCSRRQIGFVLESQEAYFRLKLTEMETLIIEITNPKARRLIDDLVDLGLISVKEEKPSWNDRWKELSKNLPDTDSITEEDILEQISAVRQNRTEH
jgi:hypothetical protein